jgi:signal transduction histidine kinase
MSNQFNRFLDKLDQEKKMLIEQIELNANISAELRASISALKDAQEKILEEERFSNMGRMVTRISHHLNTPVGNAMMAVSFIEHNIDELKHTGQGDAHVSKAVAPHIDSLEESSLILNRALMETASIVDSFNKLNVELHEGLTQHVNLCDFLKTYYYHQWRSKCPDHIQIHVECEDNLEIITSTNILELIFEQLTSNAIAHGFKDRDTGNIWVKAFQKDTKTVLIFEDDGVGIPVERSEYLFQPFFNAADNMNALGIGLNIVYNAVNMTLGGHITFEHRTPSGVRFIIEMRG